MKVYELPEFPLLVLLAMAIGVFGPPLLACLVGFVCSPPKTHEDNLKIRMG